MSDQRLRELERQAASGDKEARRRLAVERFRISGDCVTGFCGNASQTLANLSVNNRSSHLPSCPTCAAKAVRREAVLALRAEWKGDLPSSIVRFSLGQVGWSLSTFRDDRELYESERTARIWLRRRRAILALNRLGTGWFKEVRKERVEPGRSFVVTFEPGSPPDTFLITAPIVSSVAENVYAFMEPGSP